MTFEKVSFIIKLTFYDEVEITKILLVIVFLNKLLKTNVVF